MNLEGKIALVTGGSRGIGRATALCLAQAGADVAINCLNDIEQGQQTVVQINALGRRGRLYTVDVTDGQLINEMAQSVAEDFGPVDILVNNAGINLDRTAAKMDPANWQRVIDVNLTGAFNCIQAVLPKMIEAGHGSIVSVSSVVAHMGNFGQTNYAASKAGLLGLTRSLALEVASKGIRVNAIAPGFIDTPMLATIPEPVRDKIKAKIPIGRFGRPEEIARAILFLVSDDASYITGEVLNINGGVYMS